MAVFNWAAGGSSNGFTTAPLNLLSSELNSLTTGQTALSSVGGSSGVFTPNTHTGRDLLGPVSFVAGGSFTPSANSYIEGWFLLYGDDTNPEKFVSNVAQARSPDWVIRLHAAAYSSGEPALCQGGLVRLPPVRFKVGARVLNASLPASGSTIKLGGVEIEVA